MKTRAIMMAAALLLATAAFGESKTYQVTGPVVDISGDSITVQKGKENWQINKSADTKGATDVKKGDKVTVEYRMTATSIEVKPAGGKAKSK